MALKKSTNDEAFKNLEYYSLVSNVCSELDTHIGCGNKVLAEFIIKIGCTCDNVKEFDMKLKEHDAQFPDYLVKNLLTITHEILRKQT